jgi:hypothetical protein
MIIDHGSGGIKYLGEQFSVGFNELPLETFSRGLAPSEKTFFHHL